MVAQNFRHAFFCAVITLIIAWPILGLKLTAVGTDVTVTGAGAFTWIAVAVAALLAAYQRAITFYRYPRPLRCPPPRGRAWRAATTGHAPVGNS